MTNPTAENKVFFAYGPESEPFVEQLALRLAGDARLSFWFAPWHAVYGEFVQEPVEQALATAQSCAVFIGGPILEWQNEQMRAAIQRRVEDNPRYRVIPVLVPGANRPRKEDLPYFLRRYQMVEFTSPHDENAFRRLLSGILGIPPIDVPGFVEAQRSKEALPRPAGGFDHGRALVIAVAEYRDERIRKLDENVLNDGRDIADLLTDPARCGYAMGRVTRLLGPDATRANIVAALEKLSQDAGKDDTAVVFFSGHGARVADGDAAVDYLVPWDTDPYALEATALSGKEFTELLRKITADRLLVVLDSCHSGGVGEPKDYTAVPLSGVSERTYDALGQGQGRVVLASSRSDEVSWAFRDERNSVFTRHVLEALRGEGPKMGDGYVRVFDVFRHVRKCVPEHVAQRQPRAHQVPFFKAELEQDFPIAIA